MKKILPIIIAILMTAGCAGNRPGSTTLYDLGPLETSAAGALPALPPVAVAEVQGPGWMDSNLIFYRLNYANNQQPRPYANARWAMPPAQLLLQRMKARIAQAGGASLAASHGATNVPVLRIEADEFSQVFEAPGKSHVAVSLRASVFRGRLLVAHKSFSRQLPAASGDAEGGARALAAASDAVIADMITWLSTQQLK